jgi:hypothetical protein
MVWNMHTYSHCQIDAGHGTEQLWASELCSVCTNEVTSRNDSIWTGRNIRIHDGLVIAFHFPIHIEHFQVDIINHKSI